MRSETSLNTQIYYSLPSPFVDALFDFLMAHTLLIMSIINRHTLLMAHTLVKWIQSAFVQKSNLNKYIRRV